MADKFIFHLLTVYLYTGIGNGVMNCFWSLTVNGTVCHLPRSNRHEIQSSYDIKIY